MMSARVRTSPFATRGTTATCVGGELGTVLERSRAPLAQCAATNAIGVPPPFQKKSLSMYYGEHGVVPLLGQPNCTVVPHQGHLCHLG